jgi:class 3 adenylate cyclase
MPHAFARQEAIIRASMAQHGGYVYKMIGGAFQVGFRAAADAVAAQRSQSKWGSDTMRG